MRLYTGENQTCPEAVDQQNLLPSCKGRLPELGRTAAGGTQLMDSSRDSQGKARCWQPLSGVAALVFWTCLQQISPSPVLSLCCLLVVPGLLFPNVLSQVHAEKLCIRFPLHMHMCMSINALASPFIFCSYVFQTDSLPVQLSIYPPTKIGTDTAARCWAPWP